MSFPAAYLIRLGLMLLATAISSILHYVDNLLFFP